MPETKYKYKVEDTSDDRCQCILNHSTLIEGDINQCGARRWVAYSNLFCKQCEETHGEAMEKKAAS